MFRQIYSTHSLISDVMLNPQKASCGVNSRVNVGVNAAAALGVTWQKMSRPQETGTK